MLKKIFLILSILLLIPNVFAWNWFTHQEIGENVYNALPEDLQNKLNLEKIKEGTIAPDKDFKDNVRHHYPQSYNLTLHWLDVAKNSLETQDYDNASYAFGVATHYVSDSFSAPHYVKNEQNKLSSNNPRNNSNHCINNYLYLSNQKNQNKNIVNQ